MECSKCFTHLGITFKLDSYQARTMQFSVQLNIDRQVWVKNSFHGLICLLLFLHPYIFTWDMPDFVRPFVRTQRWNTMLVIIPVYLLNVWVFVPQMLKKRKFGNYVASLLIAFFIAFWIGSVLNQLMMEREQFGFSFYAGGQHHMMHKLPAPPVRFIMMLLAMGVAVGTGFELIQDWGKQEKEKEALAKEKVVSELSYLKSQINPHFLFNSLNSIYYLASLKSEDTAKAVLLLSDLMRYVLYESSTHKIELEKEISHLENYIKLQELRISKKKNIQVYFSKNGDFGPFAIEPLLIIPFVENAFKHGISYKEPSYIVIQVTALQDQLQVVIANSKHPNKPMKAAKEGGIGLQNVQKRLNLLYPQKHQLAIKDTSEEYKIDLTLKLR